MREYVPSSLKELPRPMDQSGCPFPSAWMGLEQILPALLADFSVNAGTALEFGVQHGFSAAALANYFRSVTGVDTFAGDGHAGYGDPEETLRTTAARLQPFPNITLWRCDFESWGAAHARDRYDLIHVDIVHTFRETYDCGRWAVAHAGCVIFHDTVSFPKVRRAVEQLAAESGRTFYNFPRHYGLGILREGR